MKRPEIILIAAIQKDGRGIGFQNDLLHKITEDMLHFRDTTIGNTVIMGRKSWESLPEKFRPLPNRDNIVLSRDTSYEASGAQVIHKLEDALDMKNPRGKMYIIGGAEIYKAALEYADQLNLTIINAHKPADAVFPEFEDSFIKRKSRKGTSSHSDPECEFTIWESMK